VCLCVCVSLTTARDVFTWGRSFVCVCGRDSQRESVCVYVCVCPSRLHVISSRDADLFGVCVCMRGIEGVCAC